MKTSTFLAGLFVGGRSCASLGRVAFWLVFALSVYFWLFRDPSSFPASLENSLGFVLAYNLGGKAFNRFGGKGKMHASGDS